MKKNCGLILAALVLFWAPTAAFSQDESAPEVSTEAPGAGDELADPLAGSDDNEVPGEGDEVAEPVVVPDAGAEAPASGDEIAEPVVDESNEAGDETDNAGSSSNAVLQEGETPTGTVDIDEPALAAELAGMSSDELWTRYGEVSGTFEAGLGQTESLDPLSTTGNRIYFETVAHGRHLVATLKELLSRPTELSPEEVTMGNDSLLTIQQIIGSLLVEAQRCNEAKEILDEVMSNPETDARPLLRTGAERWQGRAERCVEKQRVEDEIEAAEERGHQQDLERLRVELLELDRREAEVQAELDARNAELAAIARESGQEVDGDGVNPSNMELLRLLRAEAEERDRYYYRRAQLAAIQRGRRAPRKEFGINLRAWLIGTPDFALDWMFDEHESHWDGRANVSYGGEFFIRTRRRSELVIGVDYANISSPTGWWLRNNRERGDAKWTENDMRLLTADVGFGSVAGFGNQRQFQLYFAFALGISIVQGDFIQTEVDELGCLNDEVDGVRAADATEGYLDRFQSGGACFDGSGNPRLADDTRDEDVLPPILPSASLSFGARYIISEVFSIGFEFGIKNVYTYAGLEMGIIFAKKR